MGRRTKNIKRFCQRCGKVCTPNYFYCTACHSIVSGEAGGESEAVFCGGFRFEEVPFSQKPLPEDYYFGGIDEKRSDDWDD